MLLKTLNYISPMDIIVQSRINAPSLSNEILHRERLIKLISDEENKSLILIEAPHGFGKTTLVYNFLKLKQKSFAWLTLKKDIDNFYIFVSYIIESIKKLDNNFGTETLETIKTYMNKFTFYDNSAYIISSVIGVLVNEITLEVKKPIYIVLDEFENLNNCEWISKVFDSIFENIPSNLKIIILSSETPRIYLSKLFAKRNILQIGSEELVFSKEEIENLLIDIYKLKPDNKEIDFLQNISKGWVTGIHLILQSNIRYGHGIIGENELHLEQVFDYFATDIFDCLDKKIQNFLLFSSLLDEFDILTVNSVLNINDSQEIIAELINKNVYLYSVPPINNLSSGKYKYFNLFRRFLQQKIYETMPNEEILKTLKRIGNYYIEQCNYLQGIEYCFIMGDEEKASELLCEHFMYFFKQCRYEILSKWIDQLNDISIEKKPLLLYYKALLKSYHDGSFNETILYLEKAIFLIVNEEEIEIELLIKCYVRKCKTLIRLGKNRDSIEILQELSTKELSFENRKKILYFLAYSYYQNTEYEKALGVLGTSLNDIYNCNLPSIELNVNNLYACIYLIKGDYLKSAEYYNKVIEKSIDEVEKFEAKCNLTIVYSNLLDFDKVLVNLKDNEFFILKSPIPIFRLTFLISKQSFYFELGDYEECLTILKEANEIALKINHKYYSYLTLLLIADTYYYLNDLSKAQKYYEFAFKLMNNESEIEKAEFLLMKTLIQKKKAIDFSLEEPLLKVSGVFEQTGQLHRSCYTLFHLTDYYLKTCNYQKAKKTLYHCLKVCIENGYDSILLREAFDCRSVFDFGIANDINKHHLKNLIKQTFDNLQSDLISDKAKARLTTSMNGFIDLKIVTFDNFDFTVRENTIDEKLWQRKKWKLILLYLMLNPGRELSKEKIMSVFYPEASPTNSENVFHQIVSKFRSLLRINVESLDNTPEIHTPRLVLYENKTLKLNSDYLYYVDALDFERIAKEIKNTTDKQRKIQLTQKAISLYSGDFLPGIYEAWCEDLRDKYKCMAIEILEEILPIAYKFDMNELVLTFAEKILQLDKLNESGYIYLIKYYSVTGKKNLLKQTISEMSKIYIQELNEEPPEVIYNEINSFSLTETELKK